MILRYHHMLCLLENGDIPGYRRAAVDLLTKFGKVTDPNEANNAAWYCVLAADALPDLNAPVRMAEAALAAFGPDQKRVALNTLGAALYRAGRFDEAIQRLEESVRAREVSEFPRTGLSWPWPIGKRGMARPPAGGSTSFDPTIRPRRPASCRRPSRSGSYAERRKHWCTILHPLAPEPTPNRTLANAVSSSRSDLMTSYSTTRQTLRHRSGDVGTITGIQPSMTPIRGQGVPPGPIQGTHASGTPRQGSRSGAPQAAPLREFDDLLVR